MKVIRRSKIDSILKLMEAKKDKPDVNSDLDTFMEFIVKLMKIRKNLLIDEYFTEEEYKNTMEYVFLLNREEYEKMHVFSITEDQTLLQ